ncbi:MAG: permease-like cell division protein FtsX [Firmicutes bacterium]|nr:permease-like cell division protein FtsX [Dethiobacter sp.]MBS3888156.1 permease-like cell division protein FtsX [Bacillota bacterium]
MVKPRTFGYFFASAGKSLLRNNWMTLASISTVAVSLLVLGVFLLIAVNVNAVAVNVEGQVQVTAYLAEMPSAERAGIEAKIAAVPGVTEVRFVSRQDAWQRLLEWYGENRAFLAGWEEDNPLRDSFEVRTDSPRLVSEVAAAVGGIAGVEEVLWGREIVEQLLSITRVMRLVGIVLMVGLALAAMFFIANTVRMAIFARRREISIMRYVGATNWFIRWPFVIEGLVLGMLGALLASSVLAWGYYLAVRALVAAIPFWPWVSPWPFLQQLALLLLAIGVFIGICGSGLSLRRYLDA